MSQNLVLTWVFIFCRGNLWADRLLLRETLNSLTATNLETITELATDKFNSKSKHYFSYILHMIKPFHLDNIVDL